MDATTSGLQDKSLIIDCECVSHRLVTENTYCRRYF